MNILIISAYFYPTNSPRSFRTTELAKELSRQGHCVKVIFPSTGYNYESWKDDFPNLELTPINILKWKDIKLNGSRIVLLARRIIKRLMHYLFEYPSIEWTFRMPSILKKEKTYDLLISIAVPHTIHWGISRCFKKGIKAGKVWIADCGDPFMGCTTDTFRHPFHFSWFEKSFCKRADYITIPVESAKNGYYRQFHNKLRIIPQGFNFKEIKLRKYNANGPIKFCYAGGFIAGIRDPRPILKQLSEIDVNFQFYIFTTQKDILANYVDLLKDKLIVSEYVPRLDLIQFMSTMDFLLNIENGTSIQIPSKLIDYSISGRPILSLSSITIDNEKLNSFLNRDYTMQTVVEDINKYNIENISSSFIELAE